MSTPSVPFREALRVWLTVGTLFVEPCALAVLAPLALHRAFPIVVLGLSAVAGLAALARH